MNRLAWAWIVAIPLWASAAPSPHDFAWRAPVELPLGAALARIDIPASALAHVRHRDARDVYVFDASGEVVPFAWVTPPDAVTKPPEEHTQPYPALPLYASKAQRTAPRGSLQVRIDGDDRTMWVRVDGNAAAGTERTNSVLFATRAEARAIEALDVQGTLPANTPVRIEVSTSADLAAWSPVAARGRLYRFEGDDSPSNMRLEFDAPVQLKDRYLRLDWDGQAGVSIAAVSGVVARTVTARRIRADLPAPAESASDTLEIATGFAMPVAALAIETPRDNTVVPVRVLGRSDVSQPWRVLGQTVVYRIGQGAEQVTSPPLEVNGATARWLRIVSTNHTPLAAARLRVAAEFRPAALLVVGSPHGPYILAAGSDEAPSVALPATALTNAAVLREVHLAPVAKVGAATETPAQEIGPAWLGGLSRKDLALWSVLGIGVLVLGAVAWSLARQMKDGPAGG